MYYISLFKMTVKFLDIRNPRFPDPTPTSSSDSIEILGKTLIDVKSPLWERYQAMFKLRNINTDESIKALAQGTGFSWKK